MADLHFLQRYTIENKQENSDETVLRDKLSGGYVLMKEIEVNGTEDFKRMVEALEAQKELKHEHLLSLLEYNSTNEVTAQGVRRKLVSFFEYSTHRLQDEIQVRGRENRPFEETEMWSIICSPTLGLSYLEKQNMGHGCVSVIDIFLTAEGLIKICDPAIASSSPFDYVEGYYYAPELLASFLENDISVIDNMDIFKADVFSLGVCALSAGLLEDCTDCYLYNEGVIDYELLQSKLRRLSEHYSEDYIKVLSAMLDLDVANRPNFIQLEECLVELLSNCVESEVEKSFGGMKNVRFLSRPDPTIEETQPDEEDEGDKLNAKWISSTVSYEREMVDINQDSRETQEEREMKTLLRATSESLIQQIPENNLQRSAIYELERMYDQGLQGRSPRMSGLSIGTLSKQTVRFDNLRSRYLDQIQNQSHSQSQNIHMRETYSKENINNHNLHNMVNRNSKSIVIENDIPILSNRVSINPRGCLRESVRESVEVRNGMVRSSAFQSKSPYAASKNGEELFTDPVLMQIVRTDLQRIQSKPKVTFVYPTQ